MAQTVFRKAHIRIIHSQYEDKEDPSTNLATMNVCHIQTQMDLYKTSALPSEAPTSGDATLFAARGKRLCLPPPPIRSGYF